MFIEHITIENFGTIRHYDTHLQQGLNIVESRHATELYTAIACLICNDQAQGIPSQWLRDDLLICAGISLADTVYTVHIRSISGQPRMFAVDPTGAEATARYQYALAHCREQNSAELFGGWEPRLPLRLFDYRDRDLWAVPADRSLTTKTFRRYLYQYLHDFCPEPINSQKNYMLSVNRQGKFEVTLPGYAGEIYLSETEKRLFYYHCFLNVAEFWAGFEKMRDLHHEKKPLLIRDFLEFLDASTDISNLIARTQKLRRQSIILTIPMDEETKKKWIGENNGIFFKSCSTACSLSSGSQLYTSGKTVALAPGGFGGAASCADDHENRQA